ncbi:MAG: hypothetical protein PHQ23_08475, partial [Candidatus Wallbacteria bacterium]|nr:hypothetical protein [Candidatus Wallbacteria bacterium]
MKFRLSCIPLLLLCLSLHSLHSLHADDFISIDEIQPGMDGIGKTVFEGSKVQSFPVKILGILKNNKFSDKLVINGESILVKASG